VQDLARGLRTNCPSDCDVDHAFVGWLIAYLLKALAAVSCANEFSKLSENAGRHPATEPGGIAVFHELLSRLVFWVAWVVSFSWA